MELNVKGPHCKSCAMLITDALEEIGATDIKVDLDEKARKAKVTCQYEGDEKNVIAAIEAEGYTLA